MKRKGKRIFRHAFRAAAAVLIAVTVLYAWKPVKSLLYNVTGEIEVQSAVLKQKLTSSKRLEVTAVDEEGVLDAKTSVILLGTVGSTQIRYRYTASLGIDLSRVVMDTDSDAIVFGLPAAEVLNDGIEALEVSKHNFFSRAVEKSVETLLNEQRIKCREQYLNEKQHSERTWEDTVRAFEETICSWLDPYGERHYRFEFVSLDNMPAD